jgi:hypothetical protein
MFKATTVILFLTAMQLHAQNEGGAPAKDFKYYRLNFVLKEVEAGKVKNSRDYAMIASPRGKGQIRVGGRVPVPVAPGAAQHSWVDVGVNIDCTSLQELQNQLAFRVSADISSLATAEHAQTLPPFIRQNKWDSQVIIALKKPTLLFSSDDPMSKVRLQLEVTATPID